MSKRHTDNTILYGCLIGLILFCVVALAYLEWAHQLPMAQPSDYGSSQYAESADRRINSTCIGLQGSSLAECIIDIEQSERSNYRAERDLYAQTYMMVWAFFMTTASFLTAGIAAVGLYWIRATLVETSKAVRAADDAVSVAEKFGVAQSRPYVQAALEGAYSHWDTSQSDKIFWRIRLRINNSGLTPTSNMLIKTCWRLVENDITLITMPEGIDAVKAYVRGGDSISNLDIIILGDDLWSVQSGEKRLFVFAQAIYGTDLDKNAQYITRYSAEATFITGDPRVYWDDKNPVTITWKSIPTYYCFDNECGK